MMSDLDKTVWEYFETYKSAAPQNMKELKAFEINCRANGYPDVADYLENFRLKLEWHIGKEWAVDKTDKWQVCDKGHIIGDADYCDECLKDDYTRYFEEGHDNGWGIL